MTNRQPTPAAHDSMKAGFITTVAGSLFYFFWPEMTAQAQLMALAPTLMLTRFIGKFVREEAARNAPETWHGRLAVAFFGGLF